MLLLQTVGVKGFQIELDSLLLEGCLDYPLSISEAQAVWNTLPPFITQDSIPRYCEATTLACFTTGQRPSF